MTMYILTSILTQETIKIFPEYHRKELNQAIIDHLKENVDDTIMVTTEDEDDDQAPIFDLYENDRLGNPSLVIENHQQITHQPIKS